MPKKIKFKPVIKRVKLYPEQAVLQCDCYNNGIRITSEQGAFQLPACVGKSIETLCGFQSDNVASS